jgi:hypothetical protein
MKWDIEMEWVEEWEVGRYYVELIIFTFELQFSITRITFIFLIKFLLPHLVCDFVYFFSWY